jgi:hypothetical protein
LNVIEKGTCQTTHYAHSNCFSNKIRAPEVLYPAQVAYERLGCLISLSIPFGNDLLKG